MTVYIGIDWSQLKHDVCFLNEAGAAIARVVLAHSPEGFARFEAHRQQLGVSPVECLVGIETAHNLVIDYLWGHGYTQARSASSRSAWSTARAAATGRVGRARIPAMRTCT